MAGGDGFDLPAEGRQGEAVDALEDAAFAPFDVVGGVGGGVLEDASEEEALHLHVEEGLVDVGGIEIQEGGEGFGCGGS